MYSSRERRSQCDIIRVSCHEFTAVRILYHTVLYGPDPWDLRQTGPGVGHLLYCVVVARHGTGTPAHVEPPATSKSDQTRPCLVQRRIFATMEPLQFDASNISDPSRGTSLSFSGAGHLYLAGKQNHFVDAGLRLIRLLNRSHSSIR